MQIIFKIEKINDEGFLHEKRFHLSISNSYEFKTCFVGLFNWTCLIWAQKRKNFFFTHYKCIQASPKSFLKCLTLILEVQDQIISIREKFVFLWNFFKNLHSINLFEFRVFQLNTGNHVNKLHSIIAVIVIYYLFQFEWCIQL